MTTPPRQQTPRLDAPVRQAAAGVTAVDGVVSRAVVVARTSVFFLSSAGRGGKGATPRSRLRLLQQLITSTQPIQQQPRVGRRIRRWNARRGPLSRRRRQRPRAAAFAEALTQRMTAAHDSGA
eukprot:362275-Chlamydomonas_euryale.AAC.5